MLGGAGRLELGGPKELKGCWGGGGGGGPRLEKGQAWGSKAGDSSQKKVPRLRVTLSTPRSGPGQQVGGLGTSGQGTGS